MVDGGQPLLNAFGLGSSILGTVEIQGPHHNSTLTRLGTPEADPSRKVGVFSRGAVLISPGSVNERAVGSGWDHSALCRTIYASRYLSDPAYRRKISRQLNKGESLHALNYSKINIVRSCYSANGSCSPIDPTSQITEIAPEPIRTPLTWSR
jgi:hypothetical protein